MKKEEKVYRFTLRLDENMHTALVKSAKENTRTLHSEVIQRLKHSLNPPMNLAEHVLDHMRQRPGHEQLILKDYLELINKNNKS